MSKSDRTKSTKEQTEDDVKRETKRIRDKANQVGIGDRAKYRESDKPPSN
jgi:hypothetical protein